MQTAERTSAPAALAPDAEVAGLDGATVRLLDQRGPGLTAFVFMRHVGCVFCREQVKELRDNALALERAGLKVVLLTPDRPSRARRFVDDHRVPFATFSDEPRNAYVAYGLAEGTLGQLVNPRIVARGAAATFRGTFLSRPGANPRQLPGTAIVDAAGRLCHLQRARDASDHLTSRQLIALAREIAARPDDETPGCP